MAQKVESGAAVHGSFDDLQPVDLPLDWTGAPRQRQGGMHGIAILTKAASEALEAPGLSGRDPAVELVGQALLDHGRERPGQVDRPGDRRRQLKESNRNRGAARAAAANGADWTMLAGMAGYDSVTGYGA